MAQPGEYDYIIAGGGLHGCLAALAILHNAGDAKIALIEKDLKLGGSHTWSFFLHHIQPDATDWVKPLISGEWNGYQVLFPGFHRKLKARYVSVTSENLHRVVSDRFARSSNSKLFYGDPVVSLTSDRVELESGVVLNGRLVLDARGPDEVFRRTGVQKFYGVEVLVERKSKNKGKDIKGLDHSIPCLMDATVPQWDGYRFFYVLPFSFDRLLVEETFFSDNADIDAEASLKRIESYMHNKGWRIKEILRDERGALTMPWGNPMSGHEERFFGRRWNNRSRSPIELGLRGGWFHPGTGYSFVQGTQTASLLGRYAPDPVPAKDVHALRSGLERDSRFIRFLNWMLFRAAHPEKRSALMERFYTFPEDLIDRFYGCGLDFLDPWKLLFKDPPRPSFFKIVPKTGLR